MPAICLRRCRLPPPDVAPLPAPAPLPPPFAVVGDDAQNFSPWPEVRSPKKTIRLFPQNPSQWSRVMQSSRINQSYSEFSPCGKTIRGQNVPWHRVQPSVRLKARRNTDLKVCAPSGVVLRCNPKEKADRMSAWRTGRRPMFRDLPIARHSFQFHSHYWRRVARLPFNRN